MVYPSYQQLTPKKAQEFGQSYYRRRQYDLALEAFSTAIELSDNYPIDVLDNRAATYEKLGDLKSALGDARLMLQLEKSSAQGYLRAGKILQLLDRRGDAASVYKRGLLRVPPADPLYQALRRIVNNVPQNVEPKVLDPFLVLPIELVQMVAELLGFRTLMLCLRVSKHWSHLLSSLTPLWRDLDLSQAERTVSERSIMSFIRRSKGTLTRLVICELACHDTSLLTSILSRVSKSCRGLKHLDVRLDDVRFSYPTLKAHQNLSTLILHCVLGSETAKTLLFLCQNLVHAEFHQIQHMSHSVRPTEGLERIKTLYLRYYGKITVRRANSSSLQHFLDLAPCLRELTLFGWADLFTLFPADYSSLSQLESLTLIRCGIDRFPLLPPTIRQLRIATDLCLRMDTLASQANLAANDYSQLESLTLRDIYDLKLRDITSMLSYPSDCRNSPLKILRIGRCLGLTNADLIALLTSKATKQVVELCLVGGNKINDTLSEAISEMEDLEYLDLSENSKLTGVSVKKIASKSGKPLKLLRINQCSSIGIDAVEMARRTGVEVKFLITDWETGRVRFPTHFF